MKIVHCYVLNLLIRRAPSISRISQTRNFISSTPVRCFAMEIASVSVTTFQEKSPSNVAPTLDSLYAKDHLVLLSKVLPLHSPTPF